MRTTGTAGVEYGKLRTRILMWKEMTAELILILIVLQGLIFVGLCYFFIDKTDLVISLKYILAKVLLFLKLNPNVSITLGSETFIVRGKEFIELVTVQKIIHPTFVKATTFGFMSFISYALYPTLVGYFRLKAAKDDEMEHIRGARLITEEELYQEIKRDGLTPDITIGGVKMPESAIVKHTFVVGRPGTGKTSDLYIKIQEIRERNERAVIHDPKGDYLRKFYDPKTDIIFNPLDQRSRGWTIFNEIRTKMDISAVAASLIPPASGNDYFWNNAARHLFTAIICGLYKQGKLTNADLYSYCAAELDKIERLIKGVPGAEAGLSYVQEPKLGANVQAVLMQFASAFEFMRDGDICLSNWIKDDSKTGFIFVTNYADIKDTLRPILSLAIDLLGKRMLSLPENRSRRIHYLIDETAQLQRLSTIVSLLTIGRSFGAACDLRAQDNGQMIKIYGSELYDSIINACSNNVIYAVNDPNTAKYFSLKIGEHQVRRRQISTSVRLGESGDGMTESSIIMTEPLIMASQIQLLRDFECYVKIVNYELVKNKIIRKEYPDKHKEIIHREEFNVAKIDHIKEEQEQRKQHIMEIIGGKDIDHDDKKTRGHDEEKGNEHVDRQLSVLMNNKFSEIEGPSLTDTIEDMDNLGDYR